MLTRLRNPENDNGFTLIELLVVIIIIGILAAIAIPVFLNQRKKAADASLKSDLKAAANSLETLQTDRGPQGIGYGPTADGNVTSYIRIDDGGRDATVVPEFEFKGSPGNDVEIAQADSTGYCINAVNDKSSSGVDGIYYDSKNGGIQPLGTACDGQTFTLTGSSGGSGTAPIDCAVTPTIPACQPA